MLLEKFKVCFYGRVSPEFYSMCNTGFLLLLNYYTCSGLKQQKWIILQFFEPEVWYGSHCAKIRGSIGARFFVEAVAENPYPCPFQLLEAAVVPWLMAPFFVFKASDIASLKAVWKGSLLLRLLTSGLCHNPHNLSISKSLTF